MVTSPRIRRMLRWTEHQPLWCFGYGLILLRCLLGPALHCMTHIDLFVRKEEKISATSHLEIANRFALFVDIPFFYYPVLYSLYSFLIFLLPAADWKDSELFQGFEAPTQDLRIAPCLYSYFFALWFYFCVILHSLALTFTLSSKKLGWDGMSLFLCYGGLDYGWRNPLKLSPRQRKPYQTINSMSGTQDIFQGAKMESFVF